MRSRNFLAAFAVCALLPGLAWAQGYGNSLPPQPTAIPAGQQPANPYANIYGAYPAQAPLPAPSYTDPRQAPPQPLAPGESPGVYQPPPSSAPNSPQPNSEYTTVPSTDGPDVFPAFSLPNAGTHWMFSAEAIWLERMDTTSVILGNTVTDYGSGLGYVTDILTSTDECFPLEAGVRLEAGYRFNDRNSLEATYFGLQQSTVGRTIYGDPVGNTVLAYSPWTQTDYIIGGFDNSLGYTYTSRVNSAEINQRIVAAAGPAWSLAGLWGVRFMQVADRFNLNGTDSSTGDFENLDIHTANDLLGPQIGVAWSSFWNRLEITSELKAALFANFSSASFSNLDSSGVISGNPPGFVAVDQSAHTTNVAGLLELSILARYRVSEHIWLRGGYQSYFLDGLALGPRQLAAFDHHGGLTLDGPSVGVETNW